MLIQDIAFGCRNLSPQKKKRDFKFHPSIMACINISLLVYRICTTAIAASQHVLATRDVEVTWRKAELRPQHGHCCGYQLASVYRLVSSVWEVEVCLPYWRMESCKCPALSKESPVHLNGNAGNRFDWEISPYFGCCLFFKYVLPCLY